MISTSINYHEKDFVAEIKRLTEGRGADMIVDLMQASTWPRTTLPRPWMGASFRSDRTVLQMTLILG